MTKIDIISGFLGAGKTTLIKKLLKEALKGEQVVLIENEFGEIGIDGGFLKDSGIQMKEMNSGCICCSLVGDFGKALNEVLDTYHPDRIIIEPSGVGKLSDVVAAVRQVEESHKARINSLTTVADVKKCKMYMKNFGEFYNNQVESAGTIVLSRTGSCKPEKVEECMAQLREKNPHASIVTTDWNEISGERILEVMENKEDMEAALRREVEHPEGCTCGCHDHDHDHDHHDHDHHDHDHHDHDHHDHDHHDHDHHDHDHHDHDHHHHHADEVFTSWGTQTTSKYSRERLEEILKTLSETQDYGVILRAKGIVPSKEEKVWFYFDFVPGEYEIREGEPDYTGKFCVIGSKLDEKALENLFMQQ